MSRDDNTVIQMHVVRKNETGSEYQFFGLTKGGMPVEWSGINQRWEIVKNPTYEIDARTKFTLVVRKGLLNSFSIEELVEDDLEQIVLHHIRQVGVVHVINKLLKDHKIEVYFKRIEFSGIAERFVTGAVQYVGNFQVLE